MRQISRFESRSAFLYFSAETIFNSASSARIHAALPIITSRERRPGAAFTQISASTSVLNNLVWRTRAGPISSPISCRVADRLTRFFPSSTIFLLRIETTRRILRVHSTQDRKQRDCSKTWMPALNRILPSCAYAVECVERCRGRDLRGADSSCDFPPRRYRSKQLAYRQHAK